MRCSSACAAATAVCLAAGVRGQAPGDFTARIGSAEICRMLDDPTPLLGRRLTVPVELDLAVGGVQGFSIGVATGDESVVVARWAWAPRTFALPDGPRAPDFLAVDVVDPPGGGATIRATFDPSSGGTFLPQSGLEALFVRYQVVGVPAREGCGALVSPLQLCDRLGSPPVPAAAIVGGERIPFGGANENGAIRRSSTMWTSTRMA